MNVKPVPTKFDPENVISKKAELNSVTSPNCIPRRTLRKRLYQEDQYESFISKDSVKDSKCLNESFSPSGYTFRKNDDHVLFYKLEENEMSIPEVIDCIRIDSELHDQSFFKGAPIPLSQWFRHGRECRFSRKNILKSFPAFLQSRKELYSSVF